MAKKIKKKSNVEVENIGKERAFEVEYDEETNEIVFVHHYRVDWGDGFDSDVEHCMNLEELKSFLGVILNVMNEMENKERESIGFVEKAIPETYEGNPLKDNN